MCAADTLPWHQLDFMTQRSMERPGPKLHFAHCEPTRGDDLPTIVFFHGVLRDWRSFYPLLPELREQAKLVAIDFRGHGQSAAIPGSYRVVDYVEDAIAILNRLPGRLILYGHSLGAMVALAACSQLPGRIETAILEDPPLATMGSKLEHLPLMHYFMEVQRCLQDEHAIAAEPGVDQPGMDQQAMALRVERLFQAFSQIIVDRRPDGTPIRVLEQRDEKARRYSAEALAQLDPPVLSPIATGGWLDGYHPDAWLQEVTARILLLQADPKAGGMLTDEDANYLSSQLAERCERVQFAGVGHSIHWAQPSRILELLRSVL